MLEGKELERAQDHARDMLCLSDPGGKARVYHLGYEVVKVALGTDSDYVQCPGLYPGVAFTCDSLFTCGHDARSGQNGEGTPKSW